MLIEHLDICLTAHSFEKQVGLEVMQRYESRHVAHIRQKGPALLLDNLRNAHPIVWSYFVKQKSQKEKLHPVSRKTSTTGKMTLLIVELGV